MKISISCLILLFTFSLFSQQKGAAPIPSPPAGGGGQDGATYAVVVGISDYQDEGIPDLRFADKDAEAFAGFLQSPAGGSLDEDHLKVLINEQATQAQFAGALDWLWEMAQENDRAIIYFSGHGDVEKKSLTQPGFLLCWDAPSKVYMAGGAFPLPMLQEVISTISVQNKAKVIMVADACRSGKLSGSTVGGAQITGSNLAKQYANEIKILSCQPDEYSIEGEQWGGGRGAFSYHLLDGLYGMADGNNDASVNLKEIGRYLEDRVSEEVAPQNQNPMTIGGVTEKLTDVFPEILAQLKEGKKGQMQLFAATESRGIEEEVLAQADTNIVEMYFAFQKALKDKQFLQPANASADFYFEKLSQEPLLEKLHSSMRRNYAAALQDDAQQVLNNWLDGEVEELKLSKVNRAAKYRRYPSYLQRAAKLLGEDHYMYAVLQARQQFFEGYLTHIHNRNTDVELGRKALKKYRESLQWQENAPHVYHSMAEVYFYQLLQPDSAEYFIEKAVEATPSWTQPYLNLGVWYVLNHHLKNHEKSKVYLDKVLEIDSTADQDNVFYINNLGIYWLFDRQSGEAEKYFKKAIQVDSTISMLHSNLGSLYFQHYRLDEAEAALEKALALDSTNLNALTMLGNICLVRGNRLEDAEKYYRKAVSLDSTDMKSFSALVRIAILQKNFAEGESYFAKAVALDSKSILPYTAAGDGYRIAGEYEMAEKKYLLALQIHPDHPSLYQSLGITLTWLKRFEEAEKYLIKADEISPDGPMTHFFLGDLYNKSGQYDKAETALLKAIALNPMMELSFAHNLGFLYTKTDRFEKAEEILKKGEAFPPMVGPLWVTYAVFYGRQNQVEKAFESLEKAFVNKYSFNSGHIDLEHDPDLAPLREQEQRWKALLKKYFPDQQNKD